MAKCLLPVVEAVGTSCIRRYNFTKHVIISGGQEPAIMETDVMYTKVRNQTEQYIYKADINLISSAISTTVKKPLTIFSF